jgi:hypothetical protein
MSEQQIALVIFSALAAVCVGALLPFVRRRYAVTIGLLVACVAFIGLVCLGAALTAIISSDGSY